MWSKMYLLGRSSVGCGDLSGGTAIYKTCDALTVTPDDPTFDHANPTVSGWNVVDPVWNVPFSNPPSDIDPQAVVPPGCRLLYQRAPDPAPGANGWGWFPTGIWQACDGAFGCVAPVIGTALTFSGTMYALPIAAAAADVCGPVTGTSLSVRTESRPAVFAEASVQAVPVGDPIEVIIDRVNQSGASEYVDGRWMVDLSSERAALDLDAVQGDVISLGRFFPAAGQNVAGESCNPATDIVFNPPVAADCTADGDPDCFAWWDIAPACQPPNNFINLYQLSLRVPIATSVSPGQVISLPVEVRTNDFANLGADNVAVPRPNLYRSVVEVTAVAVPKLRVTKTGPSAWPLGETMTYTIEAENEGNIDFPGLYVVDRLPRLGIGESEFTPTYGRAFHSLDPALLILESSTDGTCWDDPLNAVWNPLATQASSRAGFVSETVDVLPADTLCVRTRGGPMFRMEPDTAFFVSVDLGIPAAGVEEQRLQHRAKGGVAVAFGGPIDLVPAETVDLTTVVRDEPIVTITKMSAPDPTRPGALRWRIFYQNDSGSAATNVVITDRLPDALVYLGLGAPLSAGQNCVEADCSAIGVGPSGEGGEVSFRIDSISASDGTPGSGDDEGVIEISTDLSPGANGLIQNCATANVPLGVGGEGCFAALQEQFAFSKTVQVLPGNQGGNPRAGNLSLIGYTLTMTNNSAALPYFATFIDDLPDGVTYEPGTLTVDGAPVPDDVVVDNRIEITPDTSVNPGGTIELRFSALVDALTPQGTLINSATLIPCRSQDNESSCAPALAASVDIEIVPVNDHDGDGVPSADEDLDGNGDPRDDDSDGDLAPNYLDQDDDGDGILTAEELLVADVNARANDLDGDGIPNWLDLDTDGDLRPDLIEGTGDDDNDGIPNFRDPIDTDGPVGDPDLDGLSNREEALLGTDPFDRDTDDDGLTDGQEVGAGTSTTTFEMGADTSPLDADTDDDGISDGEEVNAGDDGFVTDPLVSDTDGDGLPDGLETSSSVVQGGASDAAGVLYAGTDFSFVPDLDLTTSTDPTNADTDDDTVPDGEEDANRNGRVDPGETDPNAKDACGDGIVANGEECDDGNRANGDGCSSICRSEGIFIGRSVGGGGCQCSAGSANITLATSDRGFAWGFAYCWSRSARAENAGSAWSWA